MQAGQKDVALGSPFKVVAFKAPKPLTSNNVVDLPIKYTTLFIFSFYLLVLIFSFFPYALGRLRWLACYIPAVWSIPLKRFPIHGRHLQTRTKLRLM